MGVKDQGEDKQTQPRDMELESRGLGPKNSGVGEGEVGREGLSMP
jgi:hypothetical protein